MFDTVRFDQRLARLIRYINLLEVFFSSSRRKLDLSAIYKKDWNLSSSISSIQIISTITNYMTRKIEKEEDTRNFFALLIL